ncbi:MAG: hypothetical protein KKC85_18095 [Gammaproteobacteria bacterium]|nr:hypothetical protein [Gammaproteobacteria bacterium]MBU1441569.1 hypothetical protein [Gammaproteobacteria bacterium]MBU2288322.1 hypothetical protein [Gammaproteobacteria bacterium]
MTPSIASKFDVTFAPLRAALCLLAVIILTGCAIHPKIAPEKLRGKTTVTIVHTPPFKNAAWIGIAGVDHFSSHTDIFMSDDGYALKTDYAGDAVQNTLNQQTASPPATRGAGMTSLVTASLVGALIQARQDATQEKAKAFDSEVRKLFPEWNVQQEFIDALLPALRQRGLQPQVSSLRTNVLVWPASSEDGKPYRSKSPDKFDPIDSDLLLQISPLAFWSAPGPLNEYRMNVSVGMAVYDAKSKAFLGRQTIVYDGPRGNIYPLYGGLVSDLPSAQPRLRQALLSLVDSVADVASGKGKQPGK